MFDFLKSFLGKKNQPQAVFNIGGYEAAAITRDRSYIYPYPREDQTNPNSYPRHEIAHLTRYLVNNYALAERILSVSEIYGIGAGLVANPGTHDQEFNEAYAPMFERWADNAFCSANNQYNFYEMQKLIVRELIIAGEVFIVLIKSPSGYPQLMLVASEDVRQSGQADDTSIDGLYVDDYGKITAYNVFSGKVMQKVDASNVIHLMRHKQIGQLRGVGAFAASLNSMRDVKDLLMLEKKAVKVHSTLAAVVKKNGGEARVNGTFGDLAVIPGTLPANTPQTPAQSLSNFALERAFPGAVSYMEPGEDVELLSSDRSTDGFMAHLETLIREVCLNISIPYEFLVNAEKLTGTGIRFALSDAAFYFSNLQNILIDGALNRIYAWVTASFINDGKIKAPANDLPWPVSFTKPISITVDQQRVTNAEIALLQNSLLTYEAFYSARGKDWKAELRQHAQEEAFLDQLSKETGVSIFRLRALVANNPASGQAVEIDEAAQEDTPGQKAA